MQEVVFENRIKEFRMKAGLTQLELAKLVGTGQSKICEWESGKYVMTPKSIKRVAESLGCDWKDLVK